MDKYFHPVVCGFDTTYCAYEIELIVEGVELEGSYLLNSTQFEIHSLTSRIVELVLTFLSALGLVISWYHSWAVDEKPLSIPGFVSSLSPFYWIFLPICLVALLYVAWRGREKLTAVLILLLAIYAELPRLVFTQPYQLEAFHQAQVYHVIREGSALGSSYPMPQGEVNHSILWAISQLVTGIDARIMVLYIAPVFLVAFSALILYALFRKPLGILLSSALAVFFLGFGFEVIYTNHYGQIFPYYAMFWPLLSRWTTSKVGGRRYFILLFIVTTALTFTHIGASLSLSLTLLLASLGIYFGAFIIQTKLPVRGSIGRLAMVCNLLLWGVLNPVFGRTVGGRLQMMFNGFTNLFRLSFQGLEYPHVRFPAMMVSEYSLLLNLKSILVFIFALVLPAALSFMVFYATSRGEGGGSRGRNPLSMMKEKIANSTFFSLIACSWLFHVGLIAVGIAGGWAIGRWFQFSIIVVLVYIATILVSLRKKDLKKLGKVMIIAAILFMLVGIHPKWDVTFTYIQIPNRSILLNKFTYQHSGPELVYTSMISPHHDLYRELYGPKTQVSVERVSLNDLLQAPIVNQPFLIVDSGVVGSMEAKYTFDRPLLEIFQEFYANQSQRMNVVYVNDEKNVRALLVEPGEE